MKNKKSTNSQLTYDLFKQQDFPSINIGKRKVITLASYLLWKMNKKGVG